MSSNIAKLLNEEKAIRGSLRVVAEELKQLYNFDDSLIDAISSIPRLLELSREVGSIEMPEHVTSFTATQPAWWFDSVSNTIEEVKLIKTARSFGDSENDKIEVLLCSGSVATVRKGVLFYTEKAAELVSCMRQMHDRLVLFNRCLRDALHSGNAIMSLVEEEEEEEE